MPHPCYSSNAIHSSLQRELPSIPVNDHKKYLRKFTVIHGYSRLLLNENARQYPLMTIKNIYENSRSFMDIRVCFSTKIPVNIR